MKFLVRNSFLNKRLTQSHLGGFARQVIYIKTSAMDKTKMLALASTVTC